MNRKATFIVMLCFYVVVGCAAVYIYHFNKSAVTNAPVITRITASNTTAEVPVSKIEAPVEQEDEVEELPVIEQPEYDIETDDSSEQLDGMRTPEELFGEEEATEEEPVNEEYVFKAIHKSGRLFIRKEPSTESEQLGFLVYGQSGDVLEDMGEWAKVDFEGTIGYVSTEYLEITPKVTEDTTADDAATDEANSDNKANAATEVN